MNFDIETEHFTVFNLLLLLLVWAITCNVILVLNNSLHFLPVLIAILFGLTSFILMIGVMIITIYISIQWIRHHNLGWWILIALVILFILSFSLESAVQQIYMREQIFRQEQPR